jgi:hypothetical protein
MDILKQNALTGLAVLVVAAGAALLAWLAYKRPKVYRRLFVWIVLLPQTIAVGFAIWNEALRQGRSIVATRIRGGERDAILSLIDGKMVPEWLVLGVPFAVLCFALLLYVLHDLLREDDRRVVTSGRP